MRIVVWNCASGLARKFGALAELAPDIAIVPEGSDPALFAPKVRGGAEFSSLWTGRLPNKGLAVVGFGEWAVKLACPIEPRLEWVIPAEVTGPGVRFNLLAVWAMNHRATEAYPIEPKRRQVQQSLDVYRDLFADDVVVAGDFNNHVRWDRPGKPSNHTNTADALQSKGLTSVYHHHRAVAFGDEREPTIYWRNRTVDGPTYHIDYCFLPNRWLTGADVRLGGYEDWVASKRSDHVPLIVDVDLSSGP